MAGQGADAGDERQADEDERQDRDDLDQREPVLDLAEHAHLRGVDRDERRRHADDPHPRRHAGKPEGEVDGDGGHFGADRQDLDEGVGGADHEAEPGRQVAIREHAERPRHRVDDRHLGERVAHHQRDQRAEQIGDDHAGPGQPDRDGAAEEQSDADRAAHRHHGDLARDQRARQPFVGRLHWIVMRDGWSARSIRGAYSSRKKPRRTPEIAEACGGSVPLRTEIRSADAPNGAVCAHVGRLAGRHAQRKERRRTQATSTT